MRASILSAIAALSVAVAGQNLLSQIPPCAQACFGNSLGTCGPLDIGCICGNSAVINGVSCCVFATCPQSDIQSTIAFATNLCKVQGVEVDTTPDCPATNGTSTGNSTSSPSPSPSSAPSATIPAGNVSASRSSALPTSTGGAASYQAGSGVIGAAVVGMLAFL